MIFDMQISRISSGSSGTFGVLIWKDTPFALSLEDKWLDNRKWVSCIPSGTYVCKRVDSPKFGNTFEIMDVQHRSHILFHKGNTSYDTNGCILVGEEFGVLAGEPAILSSSKGFSEFLRLTDGLDQFTLSIKDFW